MSKETMYMLYLKNTFVKKCLTSYKPIGKMVPIDLFDAGLPQPSICKKEKKFNICEVQ